MPRSVCWRAGRSRAPPVSSGRRRSSRASSACGESSLIRAAASSIASGSPSRRTQISATAGAFSLVTAKSGLIAVRPLDEQRDRRVLRRARRAVGSRCRIGQRQRRDRELVLAAELAAAPGWSPAPSARRSLRAARPRPARPPGPARSCRAPAAAAGRAGSPSGCPGAAARRPRGSPAPGRWSRAPAPGSLIGASATKNTPSANWSSSSAATWRPRRVLPVPPGPVSVTSRTSSRSEQRLRPSATVALAPDQRRRLDGRLCGRASSETSGGNVAGRSGLSELEDALGPGQVLEAVLARDRAASRPPAGRRGRAPAVASESSICPPCPIPRSRAQRLTAEP